MTELVKQLSRWLSRSKLAGKDRQRFSALSNLGDTARTRHIQSLHENGSLRNPDILAGALLTAADRQECWLLDQETLRQLRKNPYYYYLTSRTKHYDQIILAAALAGMRRMLIVGAGFDTRFYRYGGVLGAHGVVLAEADQAQAVAMKRQLAQVLPHAERVSYLAINLNQPDSWSHTLDWLRTDPSAPLLVIAEGVSPYVEHTAFVQFLSTLATTLPAGSWLAYDFKWRGVKDEFGVSEEVRTPFRMPTETASINELHTSLGFRVLDLTPSRALMEQHLPGWNEELLPLFQEDAAIKLMC